MFIFGTRINVNWSHLLLFQTHAPIPIENDFSIYFIYYFFSENMMNSYLFKISIQLLFPFWNKIPVIIIISNNMMKLIANIERKKNDDCFIPLFDKLFNLIWNVRFSLSFSLPLLTLDVWHSTSCVYKFSCSVCMFSMFNIKIFVMFANKFYGR